LAYWYFTSLVVLLAVLFAHDFVKSPPWMPASPNGILECFMRHDSANYRKIVNEGYRFDPDKRSMVAFFPVYPLLARGVVAMTGCSAEIALLIVSNACLAGAFVVLHRYVRLRYSTLTYAESELLAQYALLAFGVWPATMFFRMAYTEGPFFLVVLLALLGMQQRWPVLMIAGLVGLATGTRPVGVALVPVLAAHIWQTSHGWRVRLLELLAALPLSCWGLLAYMSYQWGAFGDPLAFARTQEHWRFPQVDSGWSKPWSLVCLEPIWGLYDVASPRYWERLDRHGNIVMSMMAANPIYMLAVVVLVVTGRLKRWITTNDCLLAAGLILIPYVTRGYEMSMASFARFTAVVPALYIVLAELAFRAPAPVRHGFTILSAALLAMYAALFAAGYSIF
jgi:hypothetical protein